MTVMMPVKCRCGYEEDIIIGCATTGDIPDDKETRRRAEEFKKNNTCPECGSKDWL